MVELTAAVFPVTQSSSLSVEDHTISCVVGSEPTSMGHQMPSMVIIMTDKLQLTVPIYVCGVVVMYGSPRQHIWTFDNGALENNMTH